MRTWTVTGVEAAMERRSGETYKDLISMVCEGRVIGSVDVRAGTLADCDGFRPAEPEMLAAARALYGPLGPAPRKATQITRRARRASCGHVTTTILMASTGTACPDCYDRMS